MGVSGDGPKYPTAHSKLAVAAFVGIQTRPIFVVAPRVIATSGHCPPTLWHRAAIEILLQ
jgi:hypothetical protein